MRGGQGEFLSEAEPDPTIDRIADLDLRQIKPVCGLERLT